MRLRDRRTNRRRAASGLMTWLEPMHERADQLPGRLVAVDPELELEFERQGQSSVVSLQSSVPVISQSQTSVDWLTGD